MVFLKSMCRIDVEKLKKWEVSFSSMLESAGKGRYSASYNAFKKRQVGHSWD